MNKCSASSLSNEELKDLIVFMKENKMKYRMLKKSPPTLVFLDQETCEIVKIKANMIKEETQERNGVLSSGVDKVDFNDIQKI